MRSDLVWRPISHPSIHPAASHPSREFPHVIAISVFWPKMLTKHCGRCCSFRIKTTNPRLCRYRLSRHANQYLAADLAIRGPAAVKHTNTSEPTSHYGVRVATIFCIDCGMHRPFRRPAGAHKRADTSSFRLLYSNDIEPPLSPLRLCVRHKAILQSHQAALSGCTSFRSLSPRE